MAKNQYQSDVRTALQEMLKDEHVRSSVGVARFTTRDKKVYAKIYLKFGKIYSVYSTESTPDYITRFYQSGDLSPTNLKIVSSRFGDKLSHPSIADFLIDRHMVSEDAMDNVTQDFFLSICEDVISWEEVNVDWITNETTDVLKIREQEVSKVVELLDRRKAYVAAIAEELNVSIEDLPKLTFILNKPKPFDADTPLISHQMVSCATGATPIIEAAQQFGLTNFRSLKTVYELWENDILTLIDKNVKLHEKTVKPIPPVEETQAGLSSGLKNAVKAVVTKNGQIYLPESIPEASERIIIDDEANKKKIRLVLPLSNIIDKRVLIQSTETATVLYHEYSRNQSFSSNEPILILEETDTLEDVLVDDKNIEPTIEAEVDNTIESKKVILSENSTVTTEQNESTQDFITDLFTDNDIVPFDASVNEAVHIEEEEEEEEVVETPEIEIDNELAILKESILEKIKENSDKIDKLSEIIASDDIVISDAFVRINENKSFIDGLETLNEELYDQLNSLPS